MIVRVRIIRKEGVILRDWALHRAANITTLQNLSGELISGSGNVFFPTEPFFWQCKAVVARAGKYVEIKSIGIEQ